MAAPSLRPLVALSLLLAACANTVTSDTPATDASPAAASPAADAALPDVPSVRDVPPVFVDAPLPVDRPPVVVADVPPTPVDVPPARPCERPIILSEGVPVSRAVITPVGSGFVMAWVVAASGTIAVRYFDDDLTRPTPIGPALDLPSRGAAPDSLSIAFTGDTGVLAAGSSLHFIARSDATLTLTNTLDISPRVARAVLPWGTSGFQAVASDTALLFTNGARVTVATPNDASVDPIGPTATVMPAPASGGYLALEDVGGRLRMRHFITGHGSVIESGDEAGDGASASRVLSTPAGLFRLVHGEGREVDVSLEARDPETLALRGTPTPLHAAAAWNRTTGALASAGDELFMAWAAKPPSAGFNSSLQAQWGLRAARVEAFRNEADRTLHVFAAAVTASAARAWVIFGEAGPAGAYQLRGQCVTR